MRCQSGKADGTCGGPPSHQSAAPRAAAPRIRLASGRMSVPGPSLLTSCGCLSRAESAMCSYRPVRIDCSCCTG